MVEMKHLRAVDFRTNRFFCACGWPSHVLEISEDLDCKPEHRVVEICVYVEAEPGLFKRIWTALKYIFGVRICHHDIVINNEDRAEIAEAILPEIVE